MKKPLLLLLICFCSKSVLAQDYYFELEKEAGELVFKKDYPKLVEKTSAYLLAFPAYPRMVVFHSFGLINLNRVKEAERYVNIAITGDPTSGIALLNASYYYAVTGDMDKARSYMIETIKVSEPEDKPEETITEMKQVGINTGKNEAFNAFAAWFAKTYPTIKERSLTLDKIYANYLDAIKEPEKVKAMAKQYADQFLAMSRPELSITAYTYASMAFDSYSKYSESLEMALEAYAQYKRHGCGTNKYLASMAVFQVMQEYMNTGDNEKPIQYLDEVVALSENALSHKIEIDAIKIAGNCYRILGKEEESKKLSIAAYNLSEKYGFVAGQVDAANAICAVYLGYASPSDNKIAVQYGEYAFDLSQKYRLEKENSVMANLGLAYWNLGDYGKQKAIGMYKTIIANSKQKGYLQDASLYLNNLGALMLNRNLVGEAAQYFEESVALAGSGSHLTNPKDRLAFYQSQISGYQFMAMAYAKLNNPEKVFEALEGSRARVLSERLSQGTAKKPTIADLQNLLNPDEACIMYSLISGYEVIILTITKKFASVILHDDPRFVGDIRDKYLNKGEEEEPPPQRPTNAANFEVHSLKSQQIYKRVNYDRAAVAPKEVLDKISVSTRNFLNDPARPKEVLYDILKSENRFLIVPVLNRLNGIKNLWIAPDDVLNFFPFEALRFADGKYLIEKFNVRYVHSANILAQLEQRNYDASRKPLLAMGGAIYEDLAQEPIKIQSTEDVNLFQVKLMEDLKAGKSLREEYATVFGQRAMNPLPGTLNEVKNISKNLPGADIFAGTDMTENRLKALSKSGELKKYKILHLATHGFVVNEFPDMSGVAMCIFNKEQGGEDGFLNAGEIADLQLNADLTVLSACQTAQGKIYAGEGVSGLTQSLILAGSNAALVSLWPVSDESTMLFMSTFYKEVAKGKQSYVQIINDLKRKFIKGEYGEEFRHPNYWAPFIYYGR